MYCDILQNVLLPFAEEKMPILWDFQHNNDIKHTSKKLGSGLKTDPPQSLELSPTETFGMMPNNMFSMDNKELRTIVSETIRSTSRERCQSLAKFLVGQP